MRSFFLQSNFLSNPCCRFMHIQFFSRLLFIRSELLYKSYAFLKRFSSSYRISKNRVHGGIRYNMVAFTIASCWHGTMNIHFFKKSLRIAGKLEYGRMSLTLFFDSFEFIVSKNID